jgi:signal transduction histidine kinase
MAAILAELLRSFGRADSAADLMSGVCEVLVRGLGLEGALLRVRKGGSLRVGAAVGLGVDAATLPPVPAELQPWPPTPGPFLLEQDAVARVLPALPVRCRTVHFLPLGSGAAPQGVLYLASAGPSFSEAGIELLRTVAEALGPEIGRRLEGERVRAGIQAREEALAVVAHDLRNPLHAVTVGVGMLLPRIVEPALRRPVERIQRSAQRMERLLQDLLDIHAIEGGRFTVTRGEVPATALILTALESQQSLAGQTSVIINTDVAPALPPVDADEERILQVLENLVGNALKFTPPGGVVTVAAARAEDPAWVVFSVRDTGPGIAREHLLRVFDRFYQAPVRRPTRERAGARDLQGHRRGARRQHLGGERARQGRHLPVHPAQRSRAQGGDPGRGRAGLHPPGRRQGGEPHRAGGHPRPPRLSPGDRHLGRRGPPPGAP